jgi:D-sedoheptulose 7-phosphate isomerase
MDVLTARQDTDIGFAHSYFEESRQALEASVGDAGFMAALDGIAAAMAGTLSRGGKILLCGNGGSASDAQHLAGELLSRFETDRAPLAAVALADNSAVTTAIGNDYGYEHVFERQVLGLGAAGDVLVGLTTSGKSANVLNALAAARSKGLVSVGLTGAAGGAMRALCDHLVQVPSNRTPIIQQVHMTAGHVLCELVERRLGIGRGR